MNRLRGILLGFAVAASCGGPQEPGVYGEECFRDDDCQPGLVCVGVESASDRICTNEVNGLVAMVPGPTAPAEGGAPAGGAPDLGGAPAEGGAGIVAGTGGTAGSGGTAGTSGSGGSSGGGGSAGTSGSGGTAPLAGAGGAP